MRLRGLRLKLFLLIFGVIATALFAAGVYLHARTSESVTQRIRGDLATRTALIANRIAATTIAPSTPTEFAPLARELGRLAGTRVTLLLPNGIVAGDSSVEDSAIAELENHSDRPEFIQALASGFGTSTRFSTTLGINMLYVALPWKQGDTVAGVVRVALPLTEVDAATQALLRHLGVVALFGMFVAALASSVATHIGSRAARSLTDVAARMSKGDLDARCELSGTDDFSLLGETLNDLARNLAKTVGELRSEKDRLDLVLSSMREGVLLLDGGGRIRLANSAFNEMLSLSPGIVGEKVERVLDPRGQLLARLEGALRGDDTVGEVQLTQPTQRVILADTRSLGERSGVLAVLVDLTPQRRLEAIRREFVANASHELRTPIAAISSAVETLQGPAANDPKAGPHFIGMIARNAERLRNLVEDLLSLSQLESGKLAVELCPVSLHRVAESTFSTFALAARKRGTRLTCEIPPGVSALGDQRGLEHVLGNLIDNAIKYSPPDTEVVIGVRVAGDSVELYVKDHGPGIAAEHRDRIFERFYRVDAGRSRDLGGTGLGLSIVRHWVEAMGGTIQVRSSSGLGTEFCVRLRSAEPLPAKEIV